MADLFYSFGVTQSRGRSRCTTTRTSCATSGGPSVRRGAIDLASIDILRDRERGVPRYNAFRELLHRPPIRRSTTSANPLHPGLPDELRAVYGRATAATTSTCST